MDWSGGFDFLIFILITEYICILIGVERLARLVIVSLAWVRRPEWSMI